MRRADRHSRRRWRFSRLRIVSPKRGGIAPSGWSGYFPYYAGYPERFASEILSSADLSMGAVVLDPWNGSGTTTYSATQLGIASMGFDLNPVMLTVSRARLLLPSEADSIAPLAKEICAYDRHGARHVAKNEPLTQWFDDITAAHIRGIESNIRAHLVGAMTQTPEGVRLDKLSGLAATFYVALFSVTRALAASFGTTNPTWLKTAAVDDARVRVSRGHIVEKFLAALTGMAQALAARKKNTRSDLGVAQVLIGDTTELGLPKDSVDLVLTSPPYCTRIDYVAATRIELAILSSLATQSPKDLSLKMMGTIRVPKSEIEVQADWGDRCAQFLAAVKEHPSKASEIYYYRTHLDYFHKLAKSLANISAAMRCGGKAILVVQDSYYKEVYNPLPSIVEDIAGSCGLVLRRRDDFSLAHSMAGINPHTKKYRTAGPVVESVLCFRR